MAGSMHSIPRTEPHTWQNGAPQLNGELFESEARIRGSDGEYRWFLTQGVPLRDESGKIVRWYGTNIDIDQRKRAESLLEGEKTLLEMIATGVALKEILNALCLTMRSTATARSLLFCCSFGWRSSGFRGRSKSSQRMDEANGEAANWTMCRILRDSGISRITRHRFRHCD